MLTWDSGTKKSFIAVISWRRSIGLEYLAKGLECTVWCNLIGTVFWGDRMDSVNKAFRNINIVLSRNILEKEPWS